MWARRLRLLEQSLSARFYSQSTAQALGLVRRPFARVKTADLDKFVEIVGPQSVVNDTDALRSYNTEWTKMYHGQAQVVLKPRSTKEVSEIVKHCAARNLAIVPVGGRTNLVGGTIGVFDEILVSLEHMNSVRSFDEASGAFTADAGIILQVADDYLQERGHMFPLDLGAKGTCQVGGNLSTNAGGVRVLRYGTLHGSILGIEAVLADGRIFHGLSPMRKDNSGFDLKQLFVGSEGTLGIITGFSIACPPKPQATNVALLSSASYETVQESFLLAKTYLGEILGSFEVMDDVGLLEVEKAYGYKRPLDFPEYTVLLETRGSNAQHDNEKLESLLEILQEKGIINNAVLAQSETEQRALWRWREEIPNAIGRFGGFYSYDLSVPQHAMFDIVRAVRERLTVRNLIGDTDTYPARLVSGFGHYGDGNIHVMVEVNYYDDRVLEALEPFVFEETEKYNGSVSAEHGIGLQKREKKHYSRGPEQLELMRKLKTMMDPQGILNPYKYFDGSE